MKVKNNNTGRFILRTFGILFLIYGIGLLIFGIGAGMVPIWVALGALCIVVSFRKTCQAVFSRTWVKAVLSVCVVAVVAFLIVIAANGGRTGPYEASDYIIVLGCQVNGTAPSRTLQDRLDTAYEYLTSYENTKAILSGGQGGNKEISEAEAMFRYLTSKGIDESRLILEDRSTGTYENLRNSFALLGEEQNTKICIVSSDFHLLRAKMLARKLGVLAGGYGARTYLPFIPNYYLREMLAILKDSVAY